MVSDKAEASDVPTGERQALLIDEVTQEMHDAVASSRAPPESRAFNHEIDPE